MVKLEQTLRDLEEEGVPTPRLLAQTLEALEKDLASSIGKSRKSREVLNLETGGFAPKVSG